MRRFLIVAGLLILLGGAVAYGLWQYGFLLPTPAPEPAYDVTRAERGTIASTVSATGSIEPEAELSLSFRTPGRVSQVLVGQGEQVVAGQLLAQLESREIELAKEQAEVGLEIARAQLARLTAPPREMDIAAAEAALSVTGANVTSAEAAVRSAQAAYAQLLAGPSENQLNLLRTQVRQAEATLRQAQSAYDQVKDFPAVGALPQSVQLEQATIAYEVAQAQWQVSLEPATDAEKAAALSQIAQVQAALEQARSSVIGAQNNLERLQEGPTQEDLRIAEAQIFQAALSLRQAENNLTNAQLVAPTDGVISLVTVRPGELYSGALPAVRLTDLTSFHMSVLVDEIDVRQVQEGQSVRLVLDALPDAELTGQVVRVSPTASEIAGVIAYEVEIVPEKTDLPLRAGMSATAIITTAQVENVLLVPNRYILPDRDNNLFYVYRILNQEPVLQEVQIGLRNERFSQILAGLTDGDQVALVTVSSEDQLRNALFGGGN